MTDMEPMYVPDEPADPARHAEVLAALLVRIFRTPKVSFQRGMSTAMETTGIALIIKDSRVSLTKEEIAAVAIENNRMCRETE